MDLKNLPNTRSWNLKLSVTKGNSLMKKPGIWNGLVLPTSPKIKCPYGWSWGWWSNYAQKYYLGCYMESFWYSPPISKKSDGLKNQGFPLLPVVALIEVVVGGGEYWRAADVTLSHFWISRAFLHQFCFVLICFLPYSHSAVATFKVGKKLSKEFKKGHENVLVESFHTAPHKKRWTLKRRWPI